MIEEFLKEYYQLLKKYNLDIVMTSNYELNIEDANTGKTLATDINVFIHSGIISYTDLDDNDVDIKIY